MNVNKNFKDSVFIALFAEPALLRELYCALRGITLPQDAPVSINTLENVVYMDLYNDISFEIAGKLVVLIEHQSTINPNMPLRFLLYIAKVLDRMVKRRIIYSERKHLIPWPEFYVLYNGQKPYPEQKTLRLSDLFKQPQDLGLPENINPFLELEVKVININEGKNEAILSRCKKLTEYSAFVAKVNAFFDKIEDREEAFNEALKYCQKHDILKEFLETHGSEVLNMLLEGWTREEVYEVWREDAREEGLEEGLAQGLEQGLAKGLEQGLTQGLEQGLTQGLEQGLTQGLEQGLTQGREEVLNLLNQGLSIEEIRERLTGKQTGG